MIGRYKCTALRILAKVNFILNCSQYIKKSFTRIIIINYYLTKIISKHKPFST